MHNKAYIFTCPGICWVVGAATGLLLAVLFGLGFFAFVAGLILGVATAIFLQWAFCPTYAETIARLEQLKNLDAAARAKIAEFTSPAEAPSAEPAAVLDAAPAGDTSPVSRSASPVSVNTAAKSAEAPAPAVKPEAATAPKPAAAQPSPAEPVNAAPVDRPVAADGKPELLSKARDGKADNLKEIKGVGPKLEAMLNKMGVFHFDQIASWRDAEVAWVDANLEGFKGRVTRDTWVAQAKTLAAGGATEFSARIGKGGVY